MTMTLTSHRIFCRIQAIDGSSDCPRPQQYLDRFVAATVNIMAGHGVPGSSFLDTSPPHFPSRRLLSSLLPRCGGSLILNII